MKQIDWSKAPEWATKHGIVGAYRENQIWFNDTQYTYCDGQQGGRTILFTGGCVYKPSEIYAITERPDAPQWNGPSDGLPPVGVVCEFVADMDDETDWHEELRSGMKVEVIAHFKNLNADIVAFVFDYGRSCRQVEQALSKCFRPIRTPEQIAAEERESHVLAMLCHDALGGTRRGLAEALYDAGYRKVEQGK